MDFLTMKHDSGKHLWLCEYSCNFPPISQGFNINLATFLHEGRLHMGRQPTLNAWEQNVECELHLSFCLAPRVWICLECKVFTCLIILSEGYYWNRLSCKTVFYSLCKWLRISFKWVYESDCTVLPVVLQLLSEWTEVNEYCTHRKHGHPVSTIGFECKKLWQGNCTSMIAPKSSRST